MTTGKKPPMRLSELEGEEDQAEEVSRGKAAPKREPGGLSYVDDKPSAPRRVNGSGGGGMKNILMSVVISAVIAAIMLFGFTASKQDVTTLDNNVKLVNSSLIAFNASTLKAINDVSLSASTALTEARSAKVSLEGTATKTDIAGFASAAYVDAKVGAVSIKDPDTISRVDGLESSLAAARNQLGDANNKIADLTAKVAALGVASNTTSTTIVPNEWQVYVKSVLSGGSLQLDVVAGAPTQAVVYIEFEPVNSSGFWTSVATMSMASNSTVEQVVDHFNLVPPIELSAGLDKLIPIYDLTRGVDGTWYIRTIKFTTPWFKSDTTKITKALSYKSNIASVNFKIITTAVPVTTIGTSAGW
jgi:hypothetical protein